MGCFGGYGGGYGYAAPVAGAGYGGGMGSGFALIAFFYPFNYHWMRLLELKGEKLLKQGLLLCSI